MVISPFLNPSDLSEPCLCISIGSLLNDDDGGFRGIVGESPRVALDKDGDRHDAGEDENDGEHVDRRVGGHCEKRGAHGVSQGVARQKTVSM